MGFAYGTSTEIGRARVIKQFTTTGATPATGISDVFTPASVNANGSSGGWINVSCYGSFTTATLVLERSFDGGTTWLQAYDEAGNAVTFTAAGSKRVREIEKGVYYRLRCSVFTTVTTLYGRISQ